MNRQIMNARQSKATPVLALAGKRRVVLAVLISVLVLTCLMPVHAPCAAANPQQPEWKAGVASTVITPERSMWMAGYAARTKPSDGKVHDLHAKALALQACPDRSRGNAQGARLVIVTVDLLGIPRDLRDWLQEQVYQRYKLPPEQLLLNASHTHCGPELNQLMAFVWGLPPEQIELSRQYLEELRQKLLQLVGKAIENLAPARLGYTHARAGFAMNRRWRTDGGFHISPNPDGPVDHVVPVLRIDSPDGKLYAVTFGYACHNTTLSFYKFCGDYAGFAQQYLQEAHPGATALFIAGCGGDQNPYPRGGGRSIEYCMEHGRTLANAVEAALVPRAVPVRGPIRPLLETVTLEFAELPSREQLDQQAKSDNKYERRRAEVLLKELAETGQIRRTYPYLVHVIQFGNDLTMVALAGEVVVDYSRRLKAELASPPVWVAGYSNDVFGYVPSVRVLQEGGYEAVGATLYYGLPGPFAPSVEKRIVDKVHELVDKVRVPQNK